MSDAELEAMKAGILKKGEELEPPIDPKNLVSTGSTLLDLALSGNLRGGLCRGKCFLFVGDSSSGKTFFCLTCFAEAARRPSFDGVRFVHNNVEDGALMDFAKYFGAEVAQRCETECVVGVEAMYETLDTAIEDGPVIWVNDSADALTSEDEDEIFQDNKRQRAKGKETKGTFGMSKPKAHSTMLRQVVPKLKKHGSILINICQTREDVNPATYTTKTRAGGKALKFYAHAEMWTSVAAPIYKEVRGNKLKIGNLVKIEVKKNRLTGKEWTVEVPIYFSYGIDDLESCVDFLTKWKHWAKAEKGGKIDATELGITGNKAKIIKHIEDNNLEKTFKKIVASVWASIEEDVIPERKQRYT